MQVFPVLILVVRTQDLYIYKVSELTPRLPHEFIWGDFHPSNEFFLINDVGVRSP